MFDLFWTFADDLPDGCGYPLFGAFHLTILAGIVIFIAAFVNHYAKLDPARQRRGRRNVAYLVLFLELIKDLALIIIGRMEVWNLPFHLCGLATFLYLIHYYTGNKVIGEASWCLLLPGAVSALLFPDWTYYPFLNFYSLQSYIIHAFLIIYPILALESGTIKPELKHIGRVGLFVLIAVPPVYLLNKLWGTNFMYVNWPLPDTPLALFGKWLGNPGYLLPYALLGILVILMMYLILAIRDRIAGPR